MTTTDFKFACPHCKQNLQCEAQFAGLQTQCPTCHHVINIPNPPATRDFRHLSRSSGKNSRAFASNPHKHT